MFTKARLLQLAPGAPHAIIDPMAESLEQMYMEFELDKHLRIAHFLGQVCHESAHFSRLLENLNYSAERVGAVWPRLAARAAELAHHPEALANAAYGGRLGNGDEASGDGWAYRGRGFIQITGRDNYKARGDAIGIDLIAQPELAEEPSIAVKVALGFWRSRKCNAAADEDSVEKVTKLINGGTMGLDDRRALTEKAKTIFIDEEPLIA